MFRVVVGGVASHHNLMLDQLEDVQLAIETLLAEEPEGAHELSLEIWGGDQGLTLRLGGLMSSGVRAALQASPTSPLPCEGCLLDVRLMLDSLVDAVAIEEQPGPGVFAVRLDKRA